jgi:hypothetical protein
LDIIKTGKQIITLYNFESRVEEVNYEKYTMVCAGNNYKPDWFSAAGLTQWDNKNDIPHSLYFF